MPKKPDLPVLSDPAGLPANAVEPPTGLETCLEERLRDLLEAGVPVVLMTILKTDGPVPSRAGTRAILTPAGLEGTIGGGPFETRVREEAERCLLSGRGCIVSHTGSDADCAGRRDVLCEVLSQNAAPAFALASDAACGKGRAVWLVDATEAETPLRTLILNAVPSEPPAQWADMLQKGLVRPDPSATAPLLKKLGNKAGVVTLGGRTVYVEPVRPKPVLLLCGAGPVAQEVAQLARHCDFIVDVADDRADFLTEERFPTARRLFHVAGMEGLVPACSVGPAHHIVIMTRSNELDRKALTQALASHAFYIGMMGGRTKREEIFSALRAEGVPAAELAAVRCPAGLDIGADTPAGIAVAVTAELIAAGAGRLQRLRAMP
ncbi:MAG: XdhC family protein [Desulfovibrio sp.]|nr:XdhC family protein [Desulfovibrio sp.]